MTANITVFDSYSPFHNNSTFWIADGNCWKFYID